MTSAARPTWNPAVGGNALRDRGGVTKIVSAKDLAAQTKLKYRQPGQNAPDDLAERDFREELERKELEHLKKGKRRTDGDFGEDEPPRKRLPVNIDADDESDDDDSEAGDSGSEGRKRAAPGPSDSSSDSDSDEEDDTAELLRELEKIKRERAEEKERQEREAMAKMDAEHEEEVLKGNPLMNLGAGAMDFSVKRRWDDDVVFKNQAKGVEDMPKKAFINDMLRSQFHRKFMDKYIK